MKLVKLSFLMIILSLLILFSGCDQLESTVKDLYEKFFPVSNGNGVSSDYELYEKGKVRLEIKSPYQGQSLKEDSANFRVRVIDESKGREEGETISGSVCPQVPKKLGDFQCAGFEIEDDYEDDFVILGNLGPYPGQLSEEYSIIATAYSQIDSNAAVFSACYKDPENDEGCRLIDSQGKPISRPLSGLNGPISVKDVKQILVGDSSETLNEVRFILTLVKSSSFKFFEEGDFGEDLIVTVDLEGQSGLLGGLSCGDFTFLDGSDEVEIVCPIASVSLDYGGTVLSPDFVEKVIVNLKYTYKTKAAVSINI